MTNLLRLGLVLIYPIILLVSFGLLFRRYHSIIKKDLKHILINTLIGMVLMVGGLLVFFHFENTIYAYDYAGHWIRALTLRQHFFEDPSNILSLVYNSMNNSDYSFLPALFGLAFVIVDQSYVFFSITNLLIFLLPVYLVLQVIYYRYFSDHKYLPLVVFIVFYPLYLTLFYGKVDCSGLLFIALAYALIIVPDFDESDYIDALAINLFVFLAVFLRRWYLYAVICLYLAFLIKWLFYKEKKAKDIIKLIASGIVALAVMLLFFNVFIKNAMSNNFAEAYAFYDHEGKLFSFINYISPLLLLLSVIGAIKLIKKDVALLLINIVSIVIPCALVWQIQSFEFHHYYIFLINLIILFTLGLEEIFSFNKLIALALSLVMCVQVGMIFTYAGNTMPLFTNIRKNPEVLPDKQELTELSLYIRSIEPDDQTSAFLSAGSYGIITDDLLRNALLPDIDSPKIDSAVFDIRDGFPKDIDYIRFIITVDPIIYSDEDFQHMFTIIADAVKNHPEISKIYAPIHNTVLLDKYEVTVYERTGEYTKEMKQYFYDEMLRYYPDKAAYFSYILD